MGGHFALTWRTRDGQVHRMTQWTGMLSWAVTSMGFLSEDPHHVEAVLALQEQEDTPPPLAPYGYGLVVADQQKKVILTCQGYTSPGFISCASVRLDAMRRIPDGQTSGVDQTNGDRAFHLHAAGRLARLQVLRAPAGQTDYRDTTWHEEPVAPMSWTELLTRMEQGDLDRTGQHPRNECLMINVDMQPYQVEIYDETRAGFTRMRERIRDLGFALTAEDEAAWDAFLNETFEDEGRPPASTAGDGMAESGISAAGDEGATLTDTADVVCVVGDGRSPRLPRA